MSPRLRSDSTLNGVEASGVEALRFGFRITSLEMHSTAVLRDVRSSVEN
ncbi:hypothetical protein CKA32_004643 [Geitlerinema sp. FC II]|nr:hypothetical protein CKA32_004643 [Geitlerinema sp. FC II]